MGVLPVGTVLALISLQVQGPERCTPCSTVLPMWPLNTHLDPLSSIVIVKTRQKLIWWWGGFYSQNELSLLDLWLCTGCPDSAVTSQPLLLASPQLCLWWVRWEECLTSLGPHAPPALGSVDSCISKNVVGKDVLGNCFFKRNAWRGRQKLQMGRG